jgi:hypothetical protein
MIKTAQDAYIAGRQAAMEKLATPTLDANFKILKANLGLGGGVLPLAGTVAGTGLGTYLGDQDLRSAGISAAGALGGGQITSNLGLAGLHALAAYNGLTGEEIAKNMVNGKINNVELSNKLMDHLRTSNYVMSGANLLGQLGGGAAAGYYTKKGK